MPSLPSSARAQGWGYPALSAAVTALTLLVLEVVALRHSGGAFAYPLDDVYIHLAMAETIFQGGYGVNPGEAASASSSILYPLLMLPVFGAKLQLWQPLIVNALGVVLCGALWGAGIARAQLARSLAVLLAVAGPLALNLAGVGYTGMENSLHVAASMATVLGLWTFLRKERVSALLILGVFFAPLIRLEGLALSGLACGVLVLRGRSLAGIGLGAATLAPVLGFAAFLHGLGLPIVPGSVIAKVELVGHDLGPAKRLLLGLLVNVQPLSGRLLAAGTVVCLLLPLVAPPMRREGRGIMLYVLGLAGAAHLVGGQMGWMHRYEIYILSSQALGLALVSGGLGTALRLPLQMGLMIGLFTAALAFWPLLIGRYLWNPRAVYLQQEQMSRFAKDWWKGPVAVNDLGFVAWQNPDYVLDLFGLGSREALTLRLDDPKPGWAVPLFQKHGVKFAMIYDSWMRDALGPDVVPLGELVLDDWRASLGGKRVSFYALDPSVAPRLRELLAEFAPTLPPGAFWEPAP